MLKELLTAAVKGLANQLAINPRNLRLLVLLDGEEHTAARIDAHTISDLLRSPARKRILRVKLGNLAYDIDLGSNAGRADRAPKRVRQRGYEHE